MNGCMFVPAWRITLTERLFIRDPIDSSVEPQPKQGPQDIKAIPTRVRLSKTKAIENAQRIAFGAFIQPLTSSNNEARFDTRGLDR
jgi:hypothetical protein